MSIRCRGLLGHVEPESPVVMRRGFRQAVEEAPVVAFEDLSLAADDGVVVAVVAPPESARAFASIVAGVAPPSAGSVSTSHPVVAVLRSRARPLVDQRVDRAIDRELRLRGIRVRDRAVFDEIASLAGVDLVGRTPDLSREEYSRLAPAAVVCSDVPIVILEGAFTHRPSEFERRLAARVSARRARGLITLVVLTTERALAAALGEVTVDQLVVLGDADTAIDVSVADAIYEGDDENAGDPGYTVIRTGLEAAESLEAMGLRLAVRDIRILQSGSEAKHVLGTQPFRLEVEIESEVRRSSWRVVISDVATGVVLFVAGAPSAPRVGRSGLVVDFPPGLPVGRYAVFVHGRAEDKRGRYVFASRPLAAIKCKRTLDEPLQRLEGTIAWQA